MSGCYKAPTDFRPQSVGYFSSNGKISIVGTLEVDITIKQEEWFVLWWREVFLSTYFFPPNISRSAPGGGGGGVELRRVLLGRICHVQHIVFTNNWWLHALSEAMARQGSTNYLAGKRIFAPWTRKTHTRVFRKKIGGQGFSRSITRVDTKKGSGGQFFLPGSPGTNLHTMSRVLLLSRVNGFHLLSSQYCELLVNRFCLLHVIDFA